MRKNSIKEVSLICDGSPTNSYMISEEKTWITHEDWIDEEEINLKNLQNSRLISSDLDILRCDARKYENEWEKRAQDRNIQKRLLIASALGLEDVVEKLIQSGADPCFKQNRFGYSAFNFAASTRQLVSLLNLMKKRKMTDVDASTESSKYQYNPLDQMYIELSRILSDKHDEEVHLSELFSYGDGSHFQLGHGDSMPRHTPKKVKALEGEDIALLACSDVHSAALTSNGKLFTWGKGDSKTHQFSKLGYEDVAVQVTPRQILHSVRCIDVAASNNHTVVVTNDGSLYAFGQGPDGQLGHGKSEVESPVKRVLAMKTKVVTHVACSDHHTVCLTSDGQVHTFGRGSHGQLGHTLFQNEHTPRLVTSLTNIVIKTISCGPTLTVALTEHDDVYYFGNGNPRPERIVFAFSNGTTGYVSIYRKCKIKQVVCDENHILVLTTSGELYIFNPKDIRKSSGGQQPARLFNINDKKISYIASSNNQAMALSEHGEAYQWSLDDEKKSKPQRVLIGWRVKQVKRSKQHTLIAVDRPLPVSHRVFQATCKSLVGQDDPTTNNGPQFLENGELVENGNEHGDLVEIEDLEERFGHLATSSSPREDNTKYNIPEIARESLVNDLAALLDDKSSADVAFIIAPKPAENESPSSSDNVAVVHGHRLVLSRHTYFANLFKGEQQRSDRLNSLLRRLSPNELAVNRDKATIVLLEVETKEEVESCQCAVTALLHYIYTDKLDVYCARQRLSEELKESINQRLLNMAIQFQVQHVMKYLGHRVKGPKQIDMKPLAEHLLSQLNLANTDKSVGDLKIIVEDHEEISAHKSIVSARCEYFKMLLGTEYSHYKESSSGLIVMEDIPRETLMHVLEFIYTGLLPSKITITQLMNMIIVADRLLLTQLSTISQIEVMKQLAIENVTSLLDNGLIFGLKWLVKGCVDFILRNIELMIRSDCLPSYLFNTDNQTSRHHDDEETRHLAAKELTEEIAVRCKDEPFEFFTIEHKEFIQKLMQEVAEELKSTPVKKQQNSSNNNSAKKKKKRKNSIPQVNTQPRATNSIPITPKHLPAEAPIPNHASPIKSPPSTSTTPTKTADTARPSSPQASQLVTPPSTPPTKVPASPPTPWSATAVVASPPRGPSLLDIQREQAKTAHHGKPAPDPARKQNTPLKSNGHAPGPNGAHQSPPPRSGDVVIITKARKPKQPSTPTSTSGELQKTPEAKGPVWGSAANNSTTAQSAGKLSLVDIQHEEQRRGGKQQAASKQINAPVWKPPPKPTSNLTRIQNEQQKKKEKPGQVSSVFKSLKEIQDEEEAVAQIALFYQENGFDEVTSMKIARGELILDEM